MKLKIECQVCHKLFYAQRISAKYCTESCKQSAKYRRANSLAVPDVHNMIQKAESSLAELSEFLNDDTMGTDAKMRINSHVNSLNDFMEKIDVKLIEIVSHRFDRWFQCVGCGQKVFGRVPKCEFCSETVFKPISNTNKK